MGWRARVPYEPWVLVGKWVFGSGGKNMWRRHVRVNSKEREPSGMAEEEFSIPPWAGQSQSGLACQDLVGLALT